MDFRVPLFPPPPPSATTGLAAGVFLYPGLSSPVKPPPLHLLGARKLDQHNSPTISALLPAAPQSSPAATLPVTVTSAGSHTSSFAAALKSLARNVGTASASDCRESGENVGSNSGSTTPDHTHSPSPKKPANCRTSDCSVNSRSCTPRQTAVSGYESEERNQTPHTEDATRLRRTAASNPASSALLPSIGESVNSSSASTVDVAPKSGFQPYRSVHTDTCSMTTPEERPCPEASIFSRLPAPSPLDIYQLHQAAAAAAQHSFYSSRLEEQLYLERLALLRPSLSLPPATVAAGGATVTASLPHVLSSAVAAQYPSELMHSPLYMSQTLYLQERLKLEEEARRRLDAEREKIGFYTSANINNNNNNNINNCTGGGVVKNNAAVNSNTSVANNTVTAHNNSVNSGKNNSVFQNSHSNTSNKSNKTASSFLPHNTGDNSNNNNSHYSSSSRSTASGPSVHSSAHKNNKNQPYTSSKQSSGGGRLVNGVGPGSLSSSPAWSSGSGGDGGLLASDDVPASPRRGHAPAVTMPTRTTALRDRSPLRPLVSHAVSSAKTDKRGEDAVVSSVYRPYLLSPTCPAVTPVHDNSAPPGSQPPDDAARAPLDLSTSGSAGVNATMTAATTSLASAGGECATNGHVHAVKAANVTRPFDESTPASLSAHRFRHVAHHRPPPRHVTSQHFQQHGGPLNLSGAARRQTATVPAAAAVDLSCVPAFRQQQRQRVSVNSRLDRREQRRKLGCDDPESPPVKQLHVMAGPACAPDFSSDKLDFLASVGLTTPDIKNDLELRKCERHSALHRPVTSPITIQPSCSVAASAQHDHIADALWTPSTQLSAAVNCTASTPAKRLFLDSLGLVAASATRAAPARSRGQPACVRRPFTVAVQQDSKSGRPSSADRRIDADGQPALRLSGAGSWSGVADITAIYTRYAKERAVAVQQARSTCERLRAHRQLLEASGGEWKLRLNSAVSARSRLARDQHALQQQLCLLSASITSLHARCGNKC